MQSIYDVSAPAKLNLFLHITGRRADGYHLLQSVFMLIDWCDTLHFDVRADGQVSREDLLTPLPTNDLVVRAARALQAASGTPFGAHIGIEKRVPTQAGMGGGSSDAASTLLALNRLWQLNYTLEQLTDIGLALGADVPFFLGGHNAWVEGIGEQLTPVQLPMQRYLVIKPAEGLETKLIFLDPDLKRDTPTAIISGFADSRNVFGWNGLQSVAQQHCPAISRVLEWFELQGLSGRMTGSGSAVFAHTPDEVELVNVPSTWQAKFCNSLEVHPLMGWAESRGLSVRSASL